MDRNIEKMKALYYLEKYLYEIDVKLIHLQKETERNEKLIAKLMKEKREVEEQINDYSRKDSDYDRERN